VASAGLATIAGSVLREVLAGPWLKALAGAGFIFIGAFILFGTFRQGA
jgi:hypothetical protein